MTSVSSSNLSIKSEVSRHSQLVDIAIFLGANLVSTTRKTKMDNFTMGNSTMDGLTIPSQVYSPVRHELAGSV